MLFNSSIRKELARTFAATLAVLLTIVITVMLIRTLSMASKGPVSPQDVLIVLGYMMLGYIPILLSLALFLCIVFVLARMYRDSEMVIWQSAGAGLFRLIRPVLLFSWPIIAGIAVLMLVVWPWSNQQITAIGVQFQQRSEISRIQPGEFLVSSNGNRVIFIEQQSKAQNADEYPQGRNAFLYSNDPENGNRSIVTAQTAHIEERDGDNFLVLGNGQQLEFNAMTQMRTLLSFETYAALASDNKEIINPTQKAKELSSETLLSDPTPANMGEMSWRLGLILAAINLTLIAIPLGHANPRTGKNTNLLYALLTFVIYFNLINLGRNWISNGRYSLLTVMLAIHGLMFIIALFCMLKQHYGWVFLPRFGSHKRSNKSSDRLTSLENLTDNEAADSETVSHPPIKQVKRRKGWGKLPTVRQLFYIEILSAVTLVALGFLSLFFFFDFIDNVGDMGRKGYQFHHVMIRSLLQLPSHLYELMPIAILIGTIFVLARMAQSSEFTILRTSGLSPARALKLLTVVGLVGAICTFVTGDILVPAANQAQNQFMQNFYTQQGQPERSLRTAWLKDRDENFSYAVSVLQTSKENLRYIHIYAFNKEHQLTHWIEAPSATIHPGGSWTLENARRSTLVDSGSPQARIDDSPLQDITWKNHLSAQIVAIATYKDTNMPIWVLYQYITHLRQNAQDTSSFTFAVWQKVLYPFSCLVMVMLALPFAYLHFRSGGISAKVFGGIMIGISFVVINNMFGHLGQLHHWPPVISAGTPSLIYLIASFATFTWLVRNR